MNELILKTKQLIREIKILKQIDYFGSKHTYLKKQIIDNLESLKSRLDEFNEQPNALVRLCKIDSEEKSDIQKFLNSSVVKNINKL